MKGDSPKRDRRLISENSLNGYVSSKKDAKRLEHECILSVVRVVMEKHHLARQCYQKCPSL